MNNKNSQKMNIHDWQEKILSHIRTLIKEVDPKIIEELKWKKPSNGMNGIPVWSYNGIICTGETYKDKIKLTFPKGALLEEKTNLFNSSLEAGERRAIDIYEVDNIDERAFKSLVRDALDLNLD
jgi:hypothetical protein